MPLVVRDNVPRVLICPEIAPLPAGAPPVPPAAPRRPHACAAPCPPPPADLELAEAAHTEGERRLSVEVLNVSYSEDLDWTLCIIWTYLFPKVYH